VEIKILLYIEYKSAGHYNHGERWGYRNWDIIFYLTMFVDSSLVYCS